MLWHVLVFLSSTMIAFTAIIDKYVVGKLIKEPTLPLIISAFWSVLFVILYVPFHNITTQSFCSSFIAGALFLLAGFLYFHAAKIEEISRVIALSYTSPLFLAIFAKIFLSETLGLHSYIGIILLVFGATLVSQKEGHFSRKAASLMLICALLSAIGSVLIKFALSFDDVLAVFIYNRLGVFAAALPLIIAKRKEFASLFKSKQTLALIGFNEMLFHVGAFISILATSLASVTLVNALSLIQPLLVFLFASIISFFKPELIEENIQGKALLQKLIAVVFILFGALLLTK